MDVTTGQRFRPRFGLPSGGMYLSRVLAVALGVLVVGVVGYFGARAIFDDDDGGGTVKVADKGFTLEYPNTWSPVSDKELALFPGSPLLALERDGKSGLFLVRRESKAAPTKKSFGDELDKEISDRVPDYKPGTVTTVKTAAGQAFYFSYARTKAHTANSIVVVPNGSSSFVLESASAANDRDAAKDIAEMIGSFGA
jgi:hypothetical protein